MTFQDLQPKQPPHKALFMQIRLVLKSLGIVMPILGILITSPVSATVTFLGDWTGFGSEFQLTTAQTMYVNGKPILWVADWRPNTWRMVTEAAIDRLTVMTDSTSPKKGAVLQVQVLPGDNAGSGERNEVFRMLDATGANFPVTGASGHEFYGVSVKLDPNWTSPLKDPANWNNQWGLFLQLHSPDSFSSPPAIALSAIGTFGVQMLAGNLIDAKGQRRNAELSAFTNGALNPGKWVQFLLDVVWAGDAKGSLTIYRRDEGKTAFTQVFSKIGVPTLQWNSQDPGNIGTHYWRCGYYRSVSPGITSRLWLGPIVRGTTLSEVSVAAFGAIVIPKPPSALSVRD
jgi:Polysaccharide lyase